MAMVTNPYAGRRQQYRQNLADQQAAMRDVMAGVAGIDEELERRRRQRQEEADRKRKGEREDAATQLAANERTYQRSREQASDAQRATESAARIEADRARATAATAEADRKRKAAEDEAAAKKRTEDRDRIIRSTSVDMARGLSRDELTRRAQAAGLEGPDDLLAQVDAIEQTRLQEAETRKQKLATEAAREKQALAAARRADRGPAPKGPPSPEAAEERRLRLQKLRAEIAALEGKTAGAGQPPPQKLSVGEVQSVIELQGARQLLGDLERMKTGTDVDPATGQPGEAIDTGPIANAIDWLRSKAGVGDPRRVQFKALIGTQIADYIKSISGATVSENERAQLLQNVPTAGDDDEEFVAKLQTVKRILDNKLAAMERAYKATGRPTRIFIPDDVVPVPPARSGDDEFDSLPQ